MVQAIGMALGLSMATAHAQTGTQTGPEFVVNNNSDLDDSACTFEDCSLREAINASNEDGVASKVVFDSAMLPHSATITLAGSKLPSVSSDVSIEGSGITINANHLSGIFDANSATLDLDAVSLLNASSYMGGAISNSNGTVSLTNSTLSGNSAYSNGGAIYGYNGVVNLSNSTMAHNSANQGGALKTQAASVSLTNSTLSGNSAYSGATFFSFGGGIHMTNSIFSGASGSSDCYQLSAFFFLNGVNLIEDQGDCNIPASGSLIEGTDPNLGALADNGGPTQTLAPMPGSPVIDAGDSSLVLPDVKFDQRGTGFLRKSGTAVDLGAVEYQVLFQDSFE